MLCTFEGMKGFFMHGAKSLPRCLSPSPWRRPTPDCSSGWGRPLCLCTFHLASEVPARFWGATWLAATDSGEAGSRQLRFPHLVKVTRRFQTVLRQKKARFYFANAKKLLLSSPWGPSGPPGLWRTTAGPPRSLLCLPADQQVDREQKHNRSTGSDNDYYDHKSTSQLPVASFSASSPAASRCKPAEQTQPVDKPIKDRTLCATHNYPAIDFVPRQSQWSSRVSEFVSELQRCVYLPVDTHWRHQIRDQDTACGLMWQKKKWKLPKYVRLCIYIYIYVLYDSWL